MWQRRVALAVVAVMLSVGPVSAQDQILDGKLHHLRAAGEREWSTFPEKPEGPRLVLRFQAKANATEWALRLRQQDVRQTWKVLLNGKDLERLVADENDQVIYLPIT